MKIPARILDCVSGPILAAAAFGCSTSGPAELPQPVPVVPAPMIAPAPADPVAYDAVAESERFARTDEVIAEAEVHRDQRIEDEEEAERRRRAGRIGSIGVGFSNEHWLAACGRG